MIGTRVVSLVLVFVLDAAAIAVLFRTLSGVKASWRTLLPGAFYGAIGLTVLQQLSSLFVGGAASNPLLASFASLIALLLWFNLSAQVILLAGAYIITSVDEEQDRVRARFGASTFAQRRVKRAEEGVRLATEELTHARTRRREGARREMTEWVPVFTVGAGARGREARIAAGVPLMLWAARALAGVVADELVEPGVSESPAHPEFPGQLGEPLVGRILVLAGKGDNGGDALFAAAALLQWMPQRAASADLRPTICTSTCSARPARRTRRRSRPRSLRALSASNSLRSSRGPRGTTSSSTASSASASRATQLCAAMRVRSSRRCCRMCGSDDRA